MKANLIGKALKTDCGRVGLAVSMVQPIKLRLDTQSLHGLLINNISPTVPDGALPFEHLDTVAVELPPGHEIWYIEHLFNNIRVACDATINRAVIAFAEGMVGEPGELENWPEGALVMNARSYDNGARKWPDFERNGQRDMLKHGHFGMWKDMAVRCTRHVEDGRVYRFGPAENVGEVQVQLDISYNVEQSTGLTYAVDVKLTGHILPADDPQVGLTLVHKPATTAH